jgi:chaperonin GroES
MSVNIDIAKLHPAAGYVIVSPMEKQTQTASGIYLPDSAGDKPQQGTVIAVGGDETTDSGAKKSSPSKKGDIVIYKKWGGNEVKISGVEYMFIKFDDILAVVK